MHEFANRDVTSTRHVGSISSCPNTKQRNFLTSVSPKKSSQTQANN